MGRKTTKGKGMLTASTTRSGGATVTPLHPPDTKAGQISASQRSEAAQNTALTYEQIARRAREIWIQKGCKPGQDEQNWLEAETQLKAEAARR